MSESTACSSSECTNGAGSKVLVVNPQWLLMCCAVHVNAVCPARALSLGFLNCLTLLLPVLLVLVLHQERARDKGIKKPDAGYHSIHGAVTDTTPPHTAVMVYDLEQSYPAYVVTYMK